MSYLSISNLYKDQDILLFKECYVLEKIHGTSAHISWSGEAIHFFSGGASHKLFVALFDAEKLAALFTEKVGNQKCTVYGEAYGGKIMGMSKVYGKDLRFTAFDVKMEDVWLAVPQAESFVLSLGLEFVHYVKVPTDLESLNRERDADSVQAIRNGIGPGQIREGVILRPPIEVRKNNNERVIAKHKRDEFRETQEKRHVEVDPERLKVLADAEAIAIEWVTAMRMQHVLDKLPHGDDNPLTPERTPEVIEAMREDVYREGRGEFVDSPEVKKAVGKRTATLFIKHLKSSLESEDKE